MNIEMRTIGEVLDLRPARFQERENRHLVTRGWQRVELFRGTYFSVSAGQAILPMWDINPDGKRLLMLKEIGLNASEAAVSRKINIVLNWIEELKQRVPVK